jgi:hypothetical protein
MSVVGWRNRCATMDQMINSFKPIDIISMAFELQKSRIEFLNERSGRMGDRLCHESM